MANPVKLNKLRDAIADSIADNTKAYDTPEICRGYGLEVEVDASAWNSKRLFVKTRIATWTRPQLEALAHKVLEDWDDATLEALITDAGAHGVAGDFKNLIFAAVGKKPKIVFRDAINNAIEIVENAQFCLIYDKPLEVHGLTWKELVAWWMQLNGRVSDPVPAGRTLYSRLAKSLASPPEQLLFKTYCSMYSSRGFSIPALIPQVYLHYDPYVRRDFLFTGGTLARQRMDFLLLMPGRRRVVIEVDGVQHYSDDAGRPSPKIYSEMTAEDRRLRLAGYELYRFGGYELAAERGGESIAAQFFDDLLKHHQVS